MIVLSRERTERSRTIPPFRKKNERIERVLKTIGTICKETERLKKKEWERNDLAEDPRFRTERFLKSRNVPSPSVEKRIWMTFTINFKNTFFTFSFWLYLSANLFLCFGQSLNVRSWFGKVLQISNFFAFPCYLSLKRVN